MYFSLSLVVSISTIICEFTSVAMKAVIWKAGSCHVVSNLKCFIGLSDTLVISHPAPHATGEFGSSALRSNHLRKSSMFCCKAVLVYEPWNPNQVHTDEAVSKYFRRILWRHEEYTYSTLNDAINMVQAEMRIRMIHKVAAIRAKLLDGDGAIAKIVAGFLDNRKQVRSKLLAEMD